jgi:hypothetical protein
VEIQPINRHGAKPLVTREFAKYEARIGSSLLVVGDSERKIFLSELSSVLSSLDSISAPQDMPS